MAKKSVSADELVNAIKNSPARKKKNNGTRKRAAKKQDQLPPPDVTMDTEVHLVGEYPVICANSTPSPSPEKPIGPAEDQEPIDPQKIWIPSEGFPDVTEYRIGLAAARGTPLFEIMLSIDLNPDRYAIPQLQRIITACRQYYRDIHSTGGIAYQRRLDDCQQVEWMIQSLFDCFVKSGKPLVETIIDSDGNRTVKTSERMEDSRYLKCAMDAMQLKHTIEADLQKSKGDTGINSLSSRGVTPRQLRLMAERAIALIDGKSD